ncbi:MAG: hypothetical protein FWF15_00080 [Oscillospiraceae bacterium]|nr:hypothetical protein [Oscillospiraceae bacterium]
MSVSPHNESIEPKMKDVRRDIIFRDEDYKEKFRIKDGDSIKITVAYDGEELIRKCRWLDEAHMNVGSTCYHMDEFMEKQMRIGNKYESIPDQEPKLDVVVAEPGKPPRDAVIPMTSAALREITGGEPEIIGKDKYSASVEGKNGNGTVVICGISENYLTSLHPYVAQTKKHELAAAQENFKPTLADRLESGKAKAAEHNSAANKPPQKHRHTEVGG